ELAGRSLGPAASGAIGQPQQDVARSDQNSGGAVAALQRMLAREGLAQRRHDGVAIEAFDGADRGAIATAGMDDAGARRRAVDLDRAGAAHALLAAKVRSGQHQLAAQELGELLARFGHQRPLFAVPDEPDRDPAHIGPIFSTARRSAVSASARRQGGSPGTPSAMRAASPAGSLVSAEASSITNGGPSSAA